MPFAHLLVPIDFSEPSLRALRLAIRLARHGSGRLTLVHVILPHVSALAADVPEWAAFDPGLIVRYEQELASDAHLALERVRKDEVPDDVHAELAVVTGPIAECICDETKSRGADLVVMGTTGRTGLAHLFVGSVAERVVARAPVAVLVTH